MRSAATGLLPNDATRHLFAIDVVRGLAIAGMIVVNNPGNWNAVYPPLMHAPWNGWTAADLIFPAFVFIVGATMPLALQRRVERGGRRAAFRHVATRATALFGIGLLINVVAALPHLEEVRIPGVLQRIALAFALASPIVLLTGPWGWTAAIGALLAVHTLLITSVPFAGHAAGVSTPAANLAGAVDAWLFGPAHLQTPAMDPEGIVGTLSTAATLLCGSLGGRWLAISARVWRGGVDLVGGGVLAIAAGLLWARVLPLNKPLWSGSFAIATAGVAAVALGAAAIVVAGPRRRSWLSPFIWLGVNPLAIYVMAEVVRHLLDFGWLRMGAARVGLKDVIFWRLVAPFVGDAGGATSSIVFAVATTAVWIGVAGVLYRRGVRLRI